MVELNIIFTVILSKKFDEGSKYILKTAQKIRKPSVNLKFLILKNIEQIFYFYFSLK